MRQFIHMLSSVWLQRSASNGHRALVQDRLARVSKGAIAASLVYMLAGALMVARGEATLLFVALVTAIVGIGGLAALGARQTMTTTIVQALGILATGIIVSPNLSQGWWVAIMFAGLAITHWLSFQTTLFRNRHRPLELVLALMLGALVAGTIAFQAWATISATALVSGGIMLGLIVAQWRTLSALAAHDLAAPAARIDNLQQAIERMGSGLARISAQGELLFASPLLASLLGCESYQLKGRGFFKRVHLLDQPLFLKQISDAAHGHEPNLIEIRVRADHIASGNFVWLELGATRRNDLDASGENPESVVVFRDVSSRKQQQQQLETARENAEEAARTKSRFLATIGHELRTPLNAIVGFSEMMSSNIGGELSDAHREYAEHIKDSGRHLLDVVNMLLDMSKIEAGKFELELGRFSPDQLVAPVLRMVEVPLNQKGLTIDLDISDRLPEILGDERAVRQILINLMSNAVKFSHRNGRIGILMRRRGTRLVIAISDTGVGMAEEELARIGEPFFQAGQGLARRYEGTGLGLSIVKGLIELHGGQLSATSTRDVGTTMTVLLPVDGPDAADRHDATITDISPENPNSQTEQWPERKRKAS
ncbi:MAG: PAS domain S-box protein [Hyphomicrobiaceae bacterium]|nr:PAS domain S-box protein [Hyphomicrobiaceae bacterium]MCC0023159.1 PAS domain S-box protein [Hyphomicrobiaceae bacterium]